MQIIGFIKFYTIAIQNKMATDEDWDQVYSKLGRPSKPEDYEIQINSNRYVWIHSTVIEGFRLNNIIDHIIWIWSLTKHTK